MSKEEYKIDRLITQEQFLEELVKLEVEKQLEGWKNVITDLTHQVIHLTTEIETCCKGESK